MSRRSFLLDLKAEGALALWHDYRRGDARDMSGNANHGTPSTTVVFSRDGASFPATSSVITVPDAASLRLTALTMGVWGNFKNFIDLDRLISKRSAGSVGYEFYFRTATLLAVADNGAVQRTIAATPKGANALALSALNGSTPEAFVDGISIGSFSGTTTLAGASTADLLVGNQYTTVYRCKDYIGAVVLVNRVLTATEHAKLYGELANQDWGQRVL